MALTNYQLSLLNFWRTRTEYFLWLLVDDASISGSAGRDPGSTQVGLGLFSLFSAPFLFFFFFAFLSGEPATHMILISGASLIENCCSARSCFPVRVFPFT